MFETKPTMHFSQHFCFPLIKHTFPPCFLQHFSNFNDLDTSDSGLGLSSTAAVAAITIKAIRNKKEVSFIVH